MGIQWNSGFMMLNDKEFTIEPVAELSVTEECNNTPVLTCSPCATAEFSGTIDSMNTDLLLGDTLNPSFPYTMEFDAPILIQARWHKKWRTRKKWLKRYGMKKDTIHIEGVITSIENIPEEKPLVCEEGLIATWPGFNVTFEEISFVFNEYQLRKGIMMEVL